MKINQGLNTHNSIKEMPFQRSILEEEPGNIINPKAANRPGALPGASDVELSREGLAASLGVDFAAESHNLGKLEKLGESGGLAMAHATISYENVKHLLD